MNFHLYKKSQGMMLCSSAWWCVRGDIETSIQQSMNKKGWIWGVPAPCGHHTARAKTVPSLIMDRTYLQQPPGGRTAEDSSHWPAVLGQGPEEWPQGVQGVPWLSFASLSTSPPCASACSLVVTLVLFCGHATGPRHTSTTWRLWDWCLHEPR